ncbi:MAG: 3-hydroxyacyl-CoA dehydrogenase [Pseudomonadales bacterium]|nr:MAG: 3-hydroxyacyl-CoA dehydrogenase [Pseudomonadales bacterium]
MSSQQAERSGANSSANIGVIGTGVMGRGIIQLFAQAGHKVYFYDAADGAVDQATEFVLGMLQRAADKGRISQQLADKNKASLQPCKSIVDLAGCAVVIEAIVENIAVKQKVFAELESVVAPTAILASNTSSLIVAEIAARCKNPERVVGLHFFNPVPLMKVAEVIPAVKTSRNNTDTLKTLVENTGHRAVTAADQPGFLVNHAGRGYYTEALRILEEQVASVAEIDGLMRDAAGFKMGPFELMDLTGLDVSGKVMESIYAQFQHEPRFRPSSLLAPRLAAGLFGRKTGEGWYRYEDNKRVDPEQTKHNTEVASGTVWVDPTANQATEIAELVVKAGAALTDDSENCDLLIVQPWGKDISQVCAERELDASLTVAVDPLPGLDVHRCLMISPITKSKCRDNAVNLFSCDGTAVTVINDSPGFVLQRVLATIVNIASNIAQRGIASVADIEDSVKLGLGYPKGPLAWGDAIGGDNVLQILNNIFEISGDPRYRPSFWLRRRVQLGLSLKAEEARR